MALAAAVACSQSLAGSIDGAPDASPEAADTGPGPGHGDAGSAGDGARASDVDAGDASTETEAPDGASGPTIAITTTGTVQLDGLLNGSIAFAVTGATLEGLGQCFGSDAGCSDAVYVAVSIADPADTKDAGFGACYDPASSPAVKSPLIANFAGCPSPFGPHTVRLELRHSQDGTPVTDSTGATIAATSNIDTVGTLCTYVGGTSGPNPNGCAVDDHYACSNGTSHDVACFCAFGGAWTCSCDGATSTFYGDYCFACAGPQMDNHGPGLDPGSLASFCGFVSVGENLPDAGAPDAACVVCGSTCIDVSSDPANCGSCGHDCLGGTCSGGACQPVVLATNARIGLALDATNVYYACSGGICSVPKIGGAATTIATILNPFYVAVDSTDVFFSSQSFGNVYRAPLVPVDGGSPEVFAANQSPFSFAIDGTNLYWTNSPSGSVEGALLDGGALTTYASGEAQPIGVALDTQNLYWAQEVPDGSLMTEPLSGGTPTTLVSFQANPWAVATDGTNVYWVNWGSGTLMSVPVTGGTPQTMASGLNAPTAIAIDANNVYVGEMTNVAMVPKAGGPIVYLAMDADAYQVLNLAVDDQAVYWTNVYFGEIEKVAKP